MSKLKRIEPGLYTYTHKHTNGEVIEYRVGRREKLSKARYYKKKWMIAVFTGGQRLNLCDLLPDDDFSTIGTASSLGARLRGSHTTYFDSMYATFDTAKNVMEKYIQLCDEHNHPNPLSLIQQTKENYRRAMKALVDEVVSKKFDPFQIEDIKFDIDVLNSVTLEVHTNGNGVVVLAEIGKEVIDNYRLVIDGLDDILALRDDMA